MEAARGDEVVQEVVPDDDGEVVRLTAEVEALKANPLNPKPLTPNPKPQTLNPEPLTLNSKP